MTQPPLPEPASPEEALALARSRIATSALARGAGWDELALLVGTPDERLVQRLREGETATVLREATAWLGEDTSMVTGPLMSLDVYMRGARRRTAEDDLASLRADREELETQVPPAALADLAVAMRELAQLCRAEGEAWQSADDAQGKNLRARQRSYASEHLEEHLPQVGKVLVEESLANVSRTLGRLLLAYLSAETGTDFQRAVLNDPRGRSRL